MQIISIELKKALYGELGFQFNISNDELSYEKILKKVKLGSKFNEVCESLDLEPLLVEEYIKKYVLHLILEEAINLSGLEIESISNFSDEPLLDTTIGEILENLATKMFFIESDHFCQYLSEATKKYNFQRSNEKIVWNKESYLVDGISYCLPFTERSYSLFPIYYNNFVNKIRPIKPRSWDKNIDPENFFSDLKIHYNQFTCLLTGYDSEINPTRDILEFERETDLFFLLKIYSMLPTEKIDKFPTDKEKRNYLKALTTVSLVEDIRLKLYLAEQMIK